MKKFLLLILSIIFVFAALGQGIQAPQKLSNIQLAVKYYNEKDYEKAAPLLKESINSASSKHYYRLYLYCLIQLEKYEEAENDIISELKKKRFPITELYVHWGYLLKVQERTEEADEKYNEAIKLLENNSLSYLNTANLFIQWGEYEYAKNIFLAGKGKIEGQSFNYELGNVYYSLREFENMMVEYLDLIKLDESRLLPVQSRIGSVLNVDVDDELKAKFKTMVLKKIQNYPNILAYNRLYIWLLLQEQNFAGALRQNIALDRRTGNEDQQISSLANMAVNNRDYENARNAFEYLMAKGKENPYYMQSFMQNLEVSYLIYQKNGFSVEEDGLKLSENFKSALEYFNYDPATFKMIQDYSHLLAFYLKQPVKAIEELEKGIKIRGLRKEQIGALKTEMADIYVYADDPWEATLIYSQVIEDNKENEYGNQAKLKKAKLSYYLGNFDWAQAQLDVIKASTSKLTSNDAFELSLLIGNNLNLDTTEIPLQMFSRADFQFFRNEDTLALNTLDSLENLFPYHSLVDDILFRKAKIYLRNSDYENAVASLEKIVSDFSYETLADDALFLLADTYQFYLKDIEKAQALYNQMLVDYPGSIYVVESRKRFRVLRGDDLEEELQDKEELFFKGLL